MVKRNKSNEWSIGQADALYLTPTTSMRYYGVTQSIDLSQLITWTLYNCSIYCPCYTTNHRKLSLKEVACNMNSRLQVHMYRKFSTEGAGRGSKDMAPGTFIRKRPLLAPKCFLQRENRTEIWPKKFIFLVRNQGVPLLGEAPLLENLR